MTWNTKAKLASLHFKIQTIKLIKIIMHVRVFLCEFLYVTNRLHRRSNRHPSRRRHHHHHRRRQFLLQVTAPELH